MTNYFNRKLGQISGIFKNKQTSETPDNNVKKYLPHFNICIKG
jgi:hypothetical protein